MKTCPHNTSPQGSLAGIIVDGGGGPGWLGSSARSARGPTGDGGSEDGWGERPGQDLPL